MESAYQRGTSILHLFAFCLFFVAHTADGEDYYATCTIQPLGFPGMNISGTIKLHESSSTNLTTLVGRLYGFENSSNTKRGFHVHQYGSIYNNCTTAGPHYNPFNQTHGAPNGNIRHVGDLGNIFVDSNLEAFVNITDSVISLHGNYSIANRSLVVHTGEDDLGMGNFSDSKVTGHSGFRIGCCIINLDQQTTAVTTPRTALSSATRKTRSSTPPGTTPPGTTPPGTTPPGTTPPGTTPPGTTPPGTTLPGTTPPGTTASSSTTTSKQGSPNEAASSVVSLPGFLLISFAALQLVMQIIEL